MFINTTEHAMKILTKVKQSISLMASDEQSRYQLSAPPLDMSESLLKRTLKRFVSFRNFLFLLYTLKFSS